MIIVCTTTKKTAEKLGFQPSINIYVSYFKNNFAELSNYVLSWCKEQILRPPSLRNWLLLSLSVDCSFSLVAIKFSDRSCLIVIKF